MRISDWSSDVCSSDLYLKLWWPFANAFQCFSIGWRKLPFPVIAAVHGNCFGAGMQLALGADIRIARGDAQLSIMETKRSEEHTSELQSLMRISYAVFCLTKKTINQTTTIQYNN